MSGSADRISLGTPKLKAMVKAEGAELTSLKDGEGRELLWQAEAAWPRHSPVLFPIVGKVKDDTLRIGEASFPMGQHGFARDSRFTLVEHDATGCRFLLQDSEATRAVYPFAFRFEVAYALHGATLAVTYSVTNAGEGTLPFSVGAHPAFRWPLPGSAGKLAHRIEFEQEEAGPFFRLNDKGLIDQTPHALPTHGRALGLREDLFRPSAMILLNPASRRLQYGAPGAPGLEVAWQGFGQLGLWMKPGADFLCIEPWAGHADIDGYDVDLWSKPGIEMLNAGETRRFTWRVSITN